MALAPGHWHVQVQAKNEFGWSEYSTDQDLIVQGNFRLKQYSI